MSECTCDKMAEFHKEGCPAGIEQARWAAMSDLDLVLTVRACGHATLVACKRCGKCLRCCNAAKPPESVPPAPSEIAKLPKQYQGRWTYEYNEKRECFQVYTGGFCIAEVEDSEVADTICTLRNNAKPAPAAAQEKLATLEKWHQALNARASVITERDAAESALTAAKARIEELEAKDKAVWKLCKAIKTYFGGSVYATTIAAALAEVEAAGKGE